MTPMFLWGACMSVWAGVFAALYANPDLAKSMHETASPYLPDQYKVKAKPKKILQYSFADKTSPPPQPKYEPYVPPVEPARSCTLSKYSSDVVTPDVMPILTENSTRCFVMTGIVDKWPGTKKWTPEYLTSMGVGEIPPPEVDRDGIQFDGTVLDRNHEGAKHLQADCPREDFDGVLGTNQNFANEWDGVAYRRYILRGELGRGGGLHVDPFREGFWHAHLQGRKRWMFMPKERFDWLTETHDFDREAIPAREFFEDYAPVLREFDDVDDCDLEEGETLVCPHDVWHIVQHLSKHTASCSEQLLYESNAVEMIGDVAKTALGESVSDTFYLGLVVAMRCSALSASASTTPSLLTAACRNAEVTAVFSRMCDDFCPDADDRFAQSCEKFCGDNPGIIPNILATGG